MSGQVKTQLASRTFIYAWFEIIFKEGGSRSELLTACSTIAKFASVKLESGGSSSSVDELHKIMALFREIKDLFQSSVKSHDQEACEDGILEYDLYECCYNVA